MRGFVSHLSSSSAEVRLAEALFRKPQGNLVCVTCFFSRGPVESRAVVLRFVCCGFDLYFLGVGLGVRIIVGIALNICSVFLVLGVLFLWLHGPAFGSDRIIGFATLRLKRA